MTAAVLDRAREPRPLPVPVLLGLHEGRRIVLHPVALAGFVLMLVVTFSESTNGPRDAFELLSTGPTFFYGVFTYFAANLVASRDRRAGSGELLAVAPSPATTRVAGLCVAALLPALVCAVYVGVGDAVLSAQGAYEVEPTVWHLAQGPLTVLGAALLGIMVARLTAVPGVALLVMLAMVAYDAWLSEASFALQPLATYVSWARWGAGSAWYGLEPGSVAWHDAYLLALCAMAACGAFLREAGNRWRVLGVGAALTALAVVPALAQLP